MLASQFEIASLSVEDAEVLICRLKSHIATEELMTAAQLREHLSAPVLLEEWAEDAGYRFEELRETFEHDFEEYVAQRCSEDDGTYDQYQNGAFAEEISSFVSEALGEGFNNVW